MDIGHKYVFIGLLREAWANRLYRSWDWIILTNIHVINGSSIAFKSMVIWMLFLIDLNLLIMKLTK